VFRLYRLNVQVIQVKFTKISYIGNLFKVLVYTCFCFIQNGLDRFYHTTDLAQVTTKLYHIMYYVHLE